jgi:hypothetical protein
VTDTTVNDTAVTDTTVTGYRRLFFSDARVAIRVFRGRPIALVAAAILRSATRLLGYSAARAIAASGVATRKLNDCSR